MAERSDKIQGNVFIPIALLILLVVLFRDWGFVLWIWWFLYLVFCRGFKVEHPVLRAVLPYWFFLQLSNKKILEFREFVIMNLVLIGFWFFPALVLLVSQWFDFSNLLTTNFACSIGGFLVSSNSNITLIVCLIQWFTLNAFGMALCYVNSGLADYSLEIFDAVYSLPAIKSAVPSNDPHFKAYLFVKKLTSTDYEIKTNAAISQNTFLEHREELENRIAKGFYILKCWRRDAGVYVIRIGRLKTIMGAQGIRISAVTQDDLKPYIGKPYDVANVISLGHDGVETVYHDLRIYPFNIVGGSTGSGKTMYAKNMAKEILRIKGHSALMIWVDITKGGLDCQLAEKNYYDIVKDDKIINGELRLSEGEIYSRKQSAKKNRNFVLISDENGFINLVDYIDQELEARSRHLAKHPSCTSWDEVNAMMFKRFKGYVPVPEICVIIDEWSDMCDKYWDMKTNPDVAKAMDKIIGYVSVGRNRGLKITFIAQRFTITGQFKSARNQCFFHLGFGVTENEFDYAINIKASKPPAVQGSFSIVSQTESNRGLGIVCGPKISNLAFCQAVTDADARFVQKDYRQWLVKSRGKLLSGAEEKELSKANAKQIDLLRI